MIFACLGLKKSCSGLEKSNSVSWLGKPLMVCEFQTSLSHATGSFAAMTRSPSLCPLINETSSSMTNGNYLVIHSVLLVRPRCENLLTVASSFCNSSFRRCTLLLIFCCYWFSSCCCVVALTHKQRESY